MKHKLAILFLCGALILSCCACGKSLKKTNSLPLLPSASTYDDEPKPTSMSTQDPDSTNIATPQTHEPVSPTPSILPSSEPSYPNWAGDGYTYTSDQLGITVEFPPEWKDLITMSDCLSYEGFLIDRPDQVNCISIDVSGDYVKTVTELDPNTAIAYIYWCPPNTGGPEYNYGQAVKLIEESDGSRCYCHLPMNSIAFEEGSTMWNIYYMVEQGILNGEYVIDSITDRD